MSETQNPVVLETERLLLRAISCSEDDCSHYLSLMNSPKWLQNIGDRKVYTVDAVKTYIESGMLKQWQENGYGNFVVQRKADGQWMGCCGLFCRPGLEGADLGFAFLPEFEKQGYASEAANRVVQEAFSTFGFRRMQAITDHFNEDCQRLLRRLGFSFVEEITLPNETKPTMLFVLEKKSD